MLPMHLDFHEHCVAQESRLPVHGRFPFGWLSFGQFQVPVATLAPRSRTQALGYNLTLCPRQPREPTLPAVPTGGRFCFEAQLAGELPSCPTLLLHGVPGLAAVRAESFI